MPFRFLALALTAITLLAPQHGQAQQLIIPPTNQFLTGADISSLPLHEQQGVRYFDGDKPEDLLAIAHRAGWNVLRVRLWVNPETKPESEVSNLDNVTRLGKRIKAAGFRFLLDLHYSDTWADPGHQKKPATWDALSLPQLVQKVHDYSRDVVAHLRENGATPDIVQVGNEIKNGFLYGSTQGGSGPQPGGGFWEPDKGGIGRATRLFNAGAQGVREGAPQLPPLVMLHVPDGQDASFIKWYFSDVLSGKNSDGLKPNYDLIGLSYYPADPWDAKMGYEPWHLAHLKESLDYISLKLHKPVLVVETNWPHAGQVRPIPGAPEFPFTPEGQSQFYAALLSTVRATPDGLGQGVLAWDTDTLNWQSVFDANGHVLPAVRTMGAR